VLQTASAWLGPWDARDRLRELGASPADFGRLLYVEPDTPASEETILDLIEFDPTLVVIDAAAGAYDLQGLDDNRRADVERFARVFVRSFWWRGVAPILLDHVVKNADSRGKYAIGSERKVGGADVHLGFEVVTPLARGGLGLYKLTTHKDRGGWLPRPRAGELELRSDPETHAISWTFKPPAEGEAERGFRPTALMERVSRYVELQSEPVSRTGIEEAVTGKVVYASASPSTASSERASQARRAEPAAPVWSHRFTPIETVNPSRPRPRKAMPTPSRPRPGGNRIARPNPRPRPTPSRPRPPSRNRPRPNSVSPY
jgi:hypothetical protein